MNRPSLQQITNFLIYAQQCLKRYVPNHGVPRISHGGLQWQIKVKGLIPGGRGPQKAKQYWISAQILTFPCRKVSIYLVHNFCTCIPYEKIWRRNDYESGMWNPILPSVYASLSPTGRTRRLAPGSSFAYICIWIRQLVCWQNYRHCSGVTFDSQSSFLCAILSAPTVRDG